MKFFFNFFFKSQKSLFVSKVAVSDEDAKVRYRATRAAKNLSMFTFLDLVYGQLFNSLFSFCWKALYSRNNVKSAKSSFSAQNNLSLLCREAADAEGLLLTCIQNNQAARKNSIQNAALKITQIGEVVQFLEAGDAAWEGVVVLLTCCCAR